MWIPQREEVQIKAKWVLLPTVKVLCRLKFTKKSTVLFNENSPNLTCYKTLRVHDDIYGQSAVPPLCSFLLLHNQESFYVLLLSYEKFSFTSTFNFLSHFFHFIFSEIHTCTQYPPTFFKRTVCSNMCTILLHTGENCLKYITKSHYIVWFQIVKENLF